MIIRRIFLLAEILDLIWPRRCGICSRLVDRSARHICSDCLNRLTFIPHNGCCRRCGRDACGLDGEFLCEDCREFRPKFDRVASVLRFADEARELVNAYKFRNRLWLVPDFVDWLEAAARARFAVAEIDLVLPMPSTFLHRLNRGYNQCSYLARQLAGRLGRPYMDSLLKRVGNPRRQGGLGEADRRRNVIGTFRVKHPEKVRELTVLVVDDIMTTGSTLSECAAELKRAGASRVWGLTLARSLRT